MTTPELPWPLPPLDRIAEAIRTPLAGVLGLLDLAAEHAAQTEAAEPILVARLSTERAVWQLSMLVDLLQAGRGELGLRPERVDVLAKLRRVSSAWVSEAQRRGLGFSLKVESGTPARVTADRQRLRQVLDVLLGHAFRRARGSNITLQVAGAPGWIEFSIFVAGVRHQEQTESADSALENSEFDLSMAHVLVGLMGASLTLHNDAGPNDPYARLRLGVQELDSEILTEQRQDLALATADSVVQGRARVLVVDDHPVNRLLARRILEGANLQVSEAVDGLDAIEQLQRSEFDLVLMDCHMPVLDGVEATRTWRRQEELLGIRPGIPILALTAFTANSQRELCLEAGMNDFLGKPYTAAELIQYVQKHLPVPLDVTEQNPEATDFKVKTDSPDHLFDANVLNGLQEALGIDEVRQIVMLFVDQYDQLLKEMGQALQSGDRALLARAAHSLKGSAGNLGLVRLSAAAQQLERLGRDSAQDHSSLERAHNAVLEAGTATLAEIAVRGLAD